MPCLICEEEKCKDKVNPKFYICQDCLRKEMYIKDGTISKEFMEDTMKIYRKNKKNISLNPF